MAEKRSQGKSQQHSNGMTAALKDKIEQSVLYMERMFQSEGARQLITIIAIVLAFALAFIAVSTAFLIVVLKVVSVAGISVV